MRALLLALALAACTLATKDEMLASNRITEDAPEAFGDTCGECKSLIRRFVAVIDDPETLAELKLLLNALCTTTGFEAECAVIVNSLEYIVKKLEPYFHDEEKICKRMHLCANPRLENFHRIGQLYLNNVGKDSANDLVCDECQLAIVEFKKAIDSADERAAIKAFLSSKICKLFPKYTKECDKVLDEFLTELWKLIDAFLANPKVACTQLGFCKKQADLPNSRLANILRIGQLYLKSVEGKDSTNDLPCDECQLAAIELKKAIDDVDARAEIKTFISEHVCTVIPKYAKECNQMFDQILTALWQFLDVLLADPKEFCAQFGVCTEQASRPLNGTAVFYKALQSI